MTKAGRGLRPSLSTCLLSVLLLAGLFAGCSSGGVERVEWTTMDTVAALQWKAGHPADSGRLVEKVKGVFAKVERLLDAFDPTSELSRLAKLPDAEVLAKCDPLVKPCYEAAFRLRDETGGLFNPRWRGPGTMDLGAIAKGFAVDLAAAALAKEGASLDLLVDLGGNLRAVSGSWVTGIADPEDDERTTDSRNFSLVPGLACATSARYYRGEHIKDGRNGADVPARVASVTVLFPGSAMLADGLSTVMFLLGPEKGEKFLNERYPAAKVIWIR